MTPPETENTPAPQAVASEPTPAQRNAERRVWAVLWGVLALLVYLTREVAFTFLLGFLISYALDPLVRRLQRWRLPRGLAVLLVFVVFGGLVALLLQLTVPLLVAQGTRAAESLKDFGHDLPKQLEHWDQQLRQRPRIKALMEQLMPEGHLPNQEELMKMAKPYLGGVASGAAAFGARLAGTIPYLILMPILIAYILSDMDRLVGTFWKLVPRRRHHEVRHVGDLLEKATVNYLKGYIKLAVIVSLLVTTALTVMGVPNALLFGFIAFFMEFLPYIGPLVMALPPIIVTFMAGQSPVPVVVFFGILQILEGQVLAPRIVGQESGLHPLMIILGLTVGGQLAGIVGMLAAIPLLSFIQQLMLYYMTTHGILIADKGAEETAPPAAASAAAPEAAG